MPSRSIEYKMTYPTAPPCMRRFVRKSDSLYCCVYRYLSKLSRGRIKRWQKRWFTIDNAFVRYYANDKSSEPKGATSIDSINSCNLVDNQIVILLDGDSEWKLKALSVSEAQKWKDALDAVLQMMEREV